MYIEIRVQWTIYQRAFTINNNGLSKVRNIVVLILFQYLNNKKTANVFCVPGKTRFEQTKTCCQGVFVNYIKVKNTQMKSEELSVDKILDAYKNTLSITLNKHAPLKKTQPYHWYF